MDNPVSRPDASKGKLPAGSKQKRRSPTFRPPPVARCNATTEETISLLIRPMALIEWRDEIDKRYGFLSQQQFSKIAAGLIEEGLISKKYCRKRRRSIYCLGIAPAEPPSHRPNAPRIYRADILESLRDGPIQWKSFYQIFPKECCPDGLIRTLLAEGAILAQPCFQNKTQRHRYLCLPGHAGSLPSSSPLEMAIVSILSATPGIKQEKLAARLVEWFDATLDTTRKWVRTAEMKGLISTKGNYGWRTEKRFFLASKSE